MHHRRVHVRAGEQLGGQVLFQAKSYGLATLTTTAASGAFARQNALVPIPYPNVNGTTRKLHFELIGVGESADQQYFHSTIPCMTGTALVATVAASGTNPGIIGGPNSSTNLTGTWANTKLIQGHLGVGRVQPGLDRVGPSQLASCWVDNAGAQISPRWRRSRTPDRSPGELGRWVFVSRPTMTLAAAGSW